MKIFTSHYLLPIIYYLLLTVLEYIVSTYYLLMTAYYSLPILYTFIEVLFRKDFGTPGGWREIRGVQALLLSILTRY